MRVERSVETMSQVESSKARSPEEDRCVGYSIALTGAPIGLGFCCVQEPRSAVAALAFEGLRIGSVAWADIPIPRVALDVGRTVSTGIASGSVENSMTQ